MQHAACQHSDLLGSCTCTHVAAVLACCYLFPVQVRTRTDLPQYNRPTSEVIRRFRDFTHLEHMLSEKNK